MLDCYKAGILVRLVFGGVNLPGFWVLVILPLWFCSCLLGSGVWCFTFCFCGYNTGNLVSRL